MRRAFTVAILLSACSSSDEPHWRKQCVQKQTVTTVAINVMTGEPIVAVSVVCVRYDSVWVQPALNRKQFSQE